MPSNPDCEFTSAIKQKSEISKMVGSIGRVTRSDSPSELFSDPIICQLEELEGHICDILGPESVYQVKVKISAVKETRVK